MKKEISFHHSFDIVTNLQRYIAVDILIGNVKLDLRSGKWIVKSEKLA